MPSLLNQVLSDIPDIEYAFIYGSFAVGTKNDKNDIDLMVEGDMPIKSLEMIKRTGKGAWTQNQSVSLSDVGNEAAADRPGPFYQQCHGRAKIMLIGKEDDLRKLTQ